MSVIVFGLMENSSTALLRLSSMSPSLAQHGIFKILTHKFETLKNLNYENSERDYIILYIVYSKLHIPSHFLLCFHPRCLSYKSATVIGQGATVRVTAAG